jgi:hypothetical protein
VGKRAEDLPFDDTPITPSPEQQSLFEPTDRSTATDERSTPWYQFCGTIDDLLATGEYGWAYETLAGIRETVYKTRRVSDGQRNAIARIEAAGERKRNDGFGRRRYEGFTGRSR